MSTTAAVPADMALHVEREIKIDAPVDIAWEALLAQLGPENSMPDGTPFPFTFEPWPGGRWYRDLGDNNGHLWGHVQVLKRPSLIEITGPLFMSYPAISHIQWRIAPDGNGSILRLKHAAIGAINPEHREGVHMGWGFMMEQIRDRALHKQIR